MWTKLAFLAVAANSVQLVCPQVFLTYCVIGCEKLCSYQVEHKDEMVSLGRDA